MSLSDFAEPARRTTHDRPGLVESFLGWLNNPASDRMKTEKPADKRGPVHRRRESGYLHDIGI
ncbi:MAG: hypothetical protein WBB85_14600 [Albidovulum sp.]|uniref:hypothetical protein n=1 Tax=Albidovulum sp. TaxID=1872424 RepID=UPI003C8FC741